MSIHKQKLRSILASIDQKLECLKKDARRLLRDAHPPTEGE